MKFFTFTFLFFGISFLAHSQVKTNLFNKKDLTGWKIYGTEKWYVENKKLVCESGPQKAYGYLATEKSYKDFELTLMFKQESNGNSGVFFHSAIKGTIISGWQVEVAPKGNNTGGIYESYKRGWIAKPDKEKDEALKVGRWNKMKIKVHGNQVITWLNGMEMVNHTDNAYGSKDGSIALQIHDGGGIKVRWKKLKITEL